MNNWIFCGSCLISFTTTITSSLFGWQWFESKKFSGQVIQENTKLAENLKGKNEILDKCHDELGKLRSRMEGIKNNDDLLKRDIFLYIDKKFQIIPRTVAVDIAEQILLLSKVPCSPTSFWQMRSTV